MLKHIDPLLTPNLLKILREMGHGDQIAIVDANFPASSCAKRLVRLDGCSATEALDAVVSVLPVDRYVDHPINTMQVVGDPDAEPEIVKSFKSIVAKHELHAQFLSIERFAFYDDVKEAYAVVATGEKRQYGNIIVQKGVL